MIKQDDGLQSVYSLAHVLRRSRSAFQQCIIRRPARTKVYLFLAVCDKYTVP